MNLRFDALFKEAIEMWPEEIDLRLIENISGDYRRYKVNGINSEISDLYIGMDSEIIMRTLQSVLYRTVHRLAKKCDIPQ